jgi:nitrogen-specific signal transduction histidine kinase
LLGAARSATTASDISIDLRRTGANAKLTITGGLGPFVGPQSDDPGGVGIELARTIIEGHRGRVEYRREAASRAVRLTVELPLRE